MRRRSRRPPDSRDEIIEHTDCRAFVPWGVYESACSKCTPFRQKYPQNFLRFEPLPEVRLLSSRAFLLTGFDYPESPEPTARE